MASQGPNILVVDDNEMNRETLARRLKQQGFTVLMANGGREAIAIVRSHPVELVLLDIMMPEIDGIEVLRILKTDEELCGIPVIMISAVEELESVMRCMEMGAEDYLTKPFDPLLLKASVLRCLKKTPPAPVQEVVNSQPTLLQPSSLEPLPPPLPQPPAQVALSVEDIVTRIVRSGKINRKAYMHLSKTLFQSLFSTHTLSARDCDLLTALLKHIQTGRIAVVD